MNQREILHWQNPDDIETLENRTEGWIAGLQMAALSLRGRQARKPIALLVGDFAGTHQYVMDRLAAEVLRQQSTESATRSGETPAVNTIAPPTSI